MSANTSMAYVARRACGCIKMATVDNPERAKENAKEIAACVRLGFAIEHVTVEWVRKESRWGCEQCREQPKERKARAAKSPAQQELPL